MRRWQKNGRKTDRTEKAFCNMDSKDSEDAATVHLGFILVRCELSSKRWSGSED
jgi:hypothetical protein